MSSIVQLAAAAGVAPSTASLALRNSPRVKEATRLRVHEAAARIGYRPDSRVGALMTRIRQSRSLPKRERIALIWVSATLEETRTAAFLGIVRRQVHRRAHELGYGVDEFCLNDEGMTPPRLERILRARGITGLVFAPPLHDMEVRLEWNWDYFTASVMGNSEWSPSLNRVGHHHYHGTWFAMERLREAGYRRPAICLYEPHHRRIHGTHQAAFLVNHPQPKKAPGMCLGALPPEPDDLCGWLERSRADALLFVVRPGERVLKFLRERCPRVRLLTLCDPDDALPGIALREDLVAASALELTVAQLNRNERGVPAHPVTLLLKGEWRGSLE